MRWSGNQPAAGWPVRVCRVVAAYRARSGLIGYSDADVPGHADAVTRLRDKPLREIARKTGGHYLDARTDPPRLAEFFRHLPPSQPPGGATWPP